MATAFQEPRLTGSADLSRLNDAERRVLRLLAEGHTAKSIAAELCTSSTAVNERLREARRKTGVGSSRELARLLKSQENRDEQIGLVSRDVLQTGLSSDAERRRRNAGVFAMIALTLVAAAGAAALLVQQPTSNEVDPLFGPLPSGENDPARLHARVRAETRDPVWAPRAEQILRARYFSIAHVTGPNNEVRVLCGATLCEVAGTIDVASRAGHEYDRNDPLNKAMRELQDKPLRDDLLKVGLEGQGGSFTGSAGKPNQMVFLQYYLRKGAEAK